MNLLDFEITPLWRSGRRSASSPPRMASSWPSRSSSGSRPLASFLAVADHAGAPRDDEIEDRLAAAAAFLRLRDFSPMQALELRLEAARAGRPAERQRR